MLDFDIYNKIHSASFINDESSCMYVYVILSYDVSSSGWSSGSHSVRVCVSGSVIFRNSSPNLLSLSNLSEVSHKILRLVMKSMSISLENRERFRERVSGWNLSEQFVLEACWHFPPPAPALECDGEISKERQTSRNSGTRQGSLLSSLSANQRTGLCTTDQSGTSITPRTDF